MTLLLAIYRGTVNDATPFPTPSKAHGSYHWAFERLLSASLVPITAAAAVTTGSQYPLIDAILGVSLVVHSHIGVSNSPYSFFLVTYASRGYCFKKFDSIHIEVFML